MRTCKQCSKPIDHRHKKAKYCSNGCKQDHYRGVHGIGKPLFLKPQSPKPVFTLHIPTPEGKTYLNNRSYINSALNDLEGRRQALITRMNYLLNRNKSLLTACAIGGGIVGANLSKGEGLFTQLLFIGGCAWLGNEIGKSFFPQALTDEQYNEVLRLNEQIKSLEYQIAGTNSQTQNLQTVKAINEAVYKPKQVTTMQKVTAKDLQKMQFESIYIDGEYGELIGATDPNFYMLIHGEKGSGKSTFALKLAKDFVKSGRVAYISAEEGIRRTLQNKIRLVGLDSPHVDFIQSSTWNEVSGQLKSDYSYVIIDSLTMFPDATPEAIRAAREKFRGAICAVMQSTKSGNFKGNSAYGHDADIVFKVENGVILSEKNRYSSVPSGQVFDGLSEGRIINMR